MTKWLSRLRTRPRSCKPGRTDGPRHRHIVVNSEIPRTAPKLDVEGITDIELTDEGLAVTAMGGSQTAPAIMRELEAQGHTVTSLDIRRASLEEVAST